MFLKPYKVKSNTPLKSSDSKKLRQRVEKSFPHVTPEQLLKLMPTKGNVTVLKLITHSNFATNIYCIDKLPMFFEIEGAALAPTLYAMWQLPELLPYFTTLPGVLPNLSNGADLMLPGVVPQGIGMNIYGRFKKDQLVAVNLTNNKSAVGIGILPRSSDDMYMSGGKGQGVKMLHIFGDKLWGHEPVLAQQIPQNKPRELQADDFPELGTDLRKPNKTSESTLAPPLTFASMTALITEINDENENNKSQSPTDIKDIENIAPIVENENANTAAASLQEEASPESILKRAFMAAIKNHGKNLQLPLLTSNFYRLYVVPEAPQNFDLKKTRYKKLSNFLKQMSEEGFIVVREESKGVDKITAVDLQHAEIVNFITDYKPPAPIDVDGNQEQPLFHASLTELYVVTDVTAAFFTKMNYKRGEGIPANQIKHIIREYVSKFGLPLADPGTRAVKLDDTLQELCKCIQATVKEIYNCVTHNMQQSYQMCSTKDISNNKPCIQMSLATRSGNKKVTLVSNVECYGIILPEFIKLCKQGAAASTTIIKLPNQKREQLQIQGNQVRFVYNLLTETYKVPPKCILGLELAMKEKKKSQKK